MKPLNYAILKYFTRIKEACTEDVIEALKGEYGKFKALNKDDVLNSLMTAEANGLLEEARVELDQAGALKIYYRAHQEGKDTINKYIKD
ncbi:hypothetical protein CACET_c30210 [Clostridium aceticum]|uniref:Uncharacterized protein n=1 Tax=Clostridium aceticum TaxID=84022 RepID=A0A0D8IBC6_9CLOT|nr:hypothetical protein [Clostridium aceticum]AKL96465.1 hypothetical protein CACET_c30210 [Clostridium aceticum]KJF27359.1 hypothetical protein TZ02_08470 [Clostridium aceticum]